MKDKEWTIFEEKIDMEKMRFHETLFTLGNGYVGSRGILEEGYGGTYFAGIYDKDKGRPLFKKELTEEEAAAQTKYSFRTAVSLIFLGPFPGGWIMGTKAEWLRISLRD